MGTLVLILRLMKDLLPLEHLNLAFQTIAVLGYDTEVAIAQVRIIVSCARDMHKLVEVLRLGAIWVTLDAGLPCFVEKLGKTDSTLLVLPDYHLGQGNEKHTEHHQSDTIWIICLVDWLKVRRNHNILHF